MAPTGANPVLALFRGQPLDTLLAAVGSVLLVIAAGWLPAPGRSADVVLWLAVAFLPYAWLVAQKAHLDWHVSATLAAVGCLSLVVRTPPPLSDDVYRVLWDGHVQRHGIDPYLQAPTDVALYDLRDPFFALVNHPDIHTIYPPLSQLAFAALGALWYDPRVMQLASAACLLGAGHALARHFGPRPAQLLVLNPLALSESALGGHLDIAVGAALLLAMVALQAGRSLRGSLWLAAAAGLKMVGLWLTPLAAVHKRSGAFVALALCSLVLLPQMWPRDGALGGAGHYARRWQGNAGGFALIQAGCAKTLAAFASPPERARGHVRLARLAPVLDWLRGGPLDPWRGALAEKKSVLDRTDFEITFLAGLLARTVVAGLLLGLVLGAAAWRAPPLTAARWLLLALLWVAPQVHPWYLMWVLPLECAYGGLAALLWSALALVAYAPLELWLRERIWLESDVIQALEYGTVGLVMACESWRSVLLRRTPLGLTPTH